MLLLIYHVDWAHKTSWILAINRSEDVSNCPENYTLARMMRRIITCCQQIRLLHPPKQCPRPLKAFWINYDSCADDVNLGETSPGTVCNEVPTFWASFLWPPEITGNHLKKKKKVFLLQMWEFQNVISRDLFGGRLCIIPAGMQPHGHRTQMSHLNIDFLERSSSEGPDVLRWLSADLPAKEQITLPH